MKGWVWPFLRRGSSICSRVRLVTQTAGTAEWSRLALNSSSPAKVLPRTGTSESTAKYKTQDVCRRWSPQKFRSHSNGRSAAALRCDHEEKKGQPDDGKRQGRKAGPTPKGWAA